MTNEKDDLYNYNTRLKSALLLIANSSIICSRDKKHIKAFLDHLAAQRVSTGRLSKYAFHLKTIVEHLNTTLEKAKRKDVEKLMVWINSQGYSPETIADYGMITKRFFKFVRCGNVDREIPFPEEVRWIRTTIKASDRKQPELLTLAEVELLISKADSLRDKCLISVGFEGGFRASELLMMNIGSVSFDNKGAMVRVSGKTGGRTVRLISSAPILSKFMETHPLRGSPEAPLWVSAATNYRNRRLKWAALSKMLKRTARCAGLKKRIHNHMLRHGSAIVNAHFLTDSELKVRYGWTMASRMPAIYVHMSSKDIDDKLESFYSNRPVVATSSNASGLATTVCSRCNERNSPGLSFCGRCGTPLSSYLLSKSSIEFESVKDMVRRNSKDIEEIKELFIASLKRPAVAATPEKSPEASPVSE
jgi:integrase/recombinase XerD